jgi:hypothetical protein
MKVASSPKKQSGVDRTVARGGYPRALYEKRSVYGLGDEADGQYGYMLSYHIKAVSSRR